MMLMQRWDDNLWLLTTDEFNEIPDGTVLTCIDGTTATKGVDEIDMDTRLGYLAYGIVDPANHPLSEQLLFFRMVT